MKNTVKAGALLVAGVIALSGCGSSEPEQESAAAETTAASATPTPTAEAQQYSAADLEAALTAVRDERGMTGLVVNDASLRPQLERTADALQNIVITPEVCGDLVTNNLAEKVDSANVAVMQLNQTDAVTILSYEDASFIEGQIESNAKQVDQCAEFQMEVDGQVSSATGKTVEASTDAETTEAYSSVVTTGAEVLEGYQISGFSGTTNISVSMTNPADSDGAVAAAEELINEILAELEKK